MRHVLLLGFLAMTGSASAAAPLGEWGGDRAMLTIGPDGATLRQDCAEGRFGPVNPDGKGAFVAKGSYDAAGPGPQAGDAAGGRPARYEGHIAGDTLHLVIHPAEGPVQKLTLIRGQRQKLIRCY